MSNDNEYISDWDKVSNPRLKDKWINDVKVLSRPDLSLTQGLEKALDEWDKTTSALKVTTLTDEQV